MGRHGGSGIGIRGGMHADIAGSRRPQGTQQKRKCGAESQSDQQQHGHHRHKNGQHLVLPPDEDHGPPVDGIPDFSNLPLSGRVLLHQFIYIVGGIKPAGTEKKRQ